MAAPLLVRRAMSSSRTHPLRALIQPGIDAVRKLWIPFVAVQLIGLTTVICYFHVPAVAAICDEAAAIKSEHGLLFSALAMSFASAIVPDVFKTLTGADRRWDRDRFEKLVHNLLLFCIGGVCVDLLYTGLGNWLGDSRAVWIVATKVCIDQFGYTPFIAVPLIAGSYSLRNAGYSVPRLLKQIDAKWYGKEIAPVLIVCWAYWIPMVTLAYVLPPKLTFVYSLIASAAASILLVAIADRDRPGSDSTIGAASTP